MTVHQSRPELDGLGVVRILLAGLLVAAATWALGSPPRPELPLGAVDAEVLVAFVHDGLQLVITVGLWYLLLAIGVQLLAMVPGPTRALRPLADRLLEVGIGVLLRRVIASSTVVGVALPTAVAAEAPAPLDEPPVMVPVDPDELDGVATSPVPGEPATEAGEATAPPVMRRPATARTPTPTTTTTTTTTTPARATAGESPSNQPGETPSTSASSLARPAGAAPTMHRVPAAVAPSGSDSRPGDTQHRVESGESFWSIAEAMADGDGNPVMTEVAHIWQQLVDRNADRLVDPGNPDLLHVGQLIDIHLT